MAIWDHGLLAAHAVSSELHADTVYDVIFDLSVKWGALRDILNNSGKTTYCDYVDSTEYQFRADNVHYRP